MKMRSIIKKCKDFLLDGDSRFLSLERKGFYNAVHDEKFLKRKFRVLMGRPLQLESPKTFNEKLQWLKLYDRKPEYTMMVDKYAVRKYIAEKLGEEYLIPLLGVWDDPGKIDFDALPDRFVLKCNHNSGLGMCICKDKSKLDIEKVKKELRKGLLQDYYRLGREWPYKDIQRRVIAEKYMSNGTGDLPDYKIHCFNGKPEFVLICRDRFTQNGLTEDFYTPQWEWMPVKRPGTPNAKAPIPKPERLDQMLEMAKTLAKDIPFARIDFYEINGEIYFGEITFFPASGMSRFEPEGWDTTFGDLLDLSAE